jgi:molecular chaperone GrpE (heat shock protein)
MSFLKRLFTPSSPTPAGPVAAAEQQVLESQVQALRLELSTREESIERLKAEIEHLRARLDSLAGERSAMWMESLMSELAAPTAQIITQADLLENQGKPVQAHDILAVARRIVRVIERRGLVLEGLPGEQASFDPAIHQPLSAGVNPQPGQPVTIRFAGVRYGSKMLLKAMVD